MSKRPYVKDSAPLSRFGVLVAQLESIGASAAQQPPDPLLCFDLLSDLISSMEDEPKESILLWQRKCEDALYSLLILGARRPVRHLASVAMAKIILKGDSISIYSRVSSLQGFLSDGKKTEPHRIAGAAQCLGELYRIFGRKITSGLLETANIAAKLTKYNEEFVRQEALSMLKNALEGSAGTAAYSAYNEAFRLITRVATADKSFVVRIAAARCLKAFADIGGPGLGVTELDSSASYCVKALEDPFPSVRDAFAEALGSLLALALNPEAQIQPRGKGPSTTVKKLEGGLDRHLIFPFAKASGARAKEMRVSLTLSWVFFLQAICLKHVHPDSELQNYTLQVLGMLPAEASVDAHVLACVLYILRVGIIDQMTEPTQRNFLVFLGKQLQSSDGAPSMKVAALRTLSYTLKTLGEVPSEFKGVFDDTIVAALSHSSQLVRIEASLTLRTVAEVDPVCVGGLISYGVTTLNALRENVAFDKGGSQKVELDSLHGQATVLAALVAISPKLPLGYPARLPRMVLEVSKKLLTETSRNATAAAVEKESGWSLLSSLLAAMPKEELEDEIFDILSLWADLFGGNPEIEVKKAGGLEYRICVWSAAIDALTVFIRNFVSLDTTKYRIMLQPVLVYLSCALSYVSLLVSKEFANTRPAMDIFVIRVLMAFQALPDPMAYKTDHPQIIELCTAPFRDASSYDESSCLRWLLDKRDAWLGPWIPGRDWFEDELRAFQGGKDGLMPCVWDNELPSFPMPETIKKTLVNQKLLLFGTMFASLDTGGMLSLLGRIEQCLKAGKKQPWRAMSVTNICVALLAGLKVLVRLRPQPLGQEILNAVQAIFQSILAEGDICASQRRASSEGLGLLVRLGSDIFTARLTRSLLHDLTGVTDSNYAGSIAFALGCVHRSAGGMALSSLVPATVSLVSSLAKSSISSLQIWSLHGLLLTIEAAGLSYVSHVQAMLGLALDILLSQGNALIDVQQGVGRLINAIVAVLGPELSPGSILFSRCKSVVAEISSCQETATLLENARFTQQLVIFAPQAVSVHTHVQTLLPTLSSRQPTLRHLAVSTLQHLIEKDPISVIEENIEENLFHMLDEETDSEIGNLVCSTMMRLFYASCSSRPSHWISIYRDIVLATSSRKNTGHNNVGNDHLNGLDGDTRPDFGEDDENMVSVSRNIPGTSKTQIRDTDKQLRYRTRIFAAECLSHLPEAVGKNPAHFDLSLARRQLSAGQGIGDWLVLHLQELVSLAYQISTIQLENMQPIGVGLLSTIINKFGAVPDPELPGHLLLEQYQAQLVSAVRTALDSSSGPILLEAGLELATKIMTCGVISGDQAAVKRMFSLISRPLNEFKDLYYPSFAEWVSSKIKVRLLAAHASLKCYVYSSLRRHEDGVPDEFLALLPLFSKNSSVLGKLWIQILKDYSYICLRMHLKKNWKPLLDGIQSPLVLSKLKPCLEEAWPVLLGAVALDAVPLILDENTHCKQSDESAGRKSLISGFGMVELKSEEFHLIWSFSLLLLFQGQLASIGEQIIPLGSAKSRYGVESIIEEKDPTVLKLYKILSPVFQSLSSKRFYAEGFLTMDTCRDLLQIFSYFTHVDNSWTSLAASVLSQIMTNCPQNFLETENFAYLAVELCLAYLLKLFQSSDAKSSNWEDLIDQLLYTSKTLVMRFAVKKHLKSVVLAFLLTGYKCIRQTPTDLSFSKVKEFFKSTAPLLKSFIHDKPPVYDDDIYVMETTLEACLNESTNLARDCIKSINFLENKRTDLRKLLQLKLAFSLEQTILFVKLAYDHVLLGGKKESNHKFFTLLGYCTKCIRSVLSDSNIQVQVVGLQVLKNMSPRGTDEEDYVTIIIAGELLPEFFMMIHKMLEKSLTKESVAVIGECLRILMLLQTILKASDCQRGIMNLLLEAIVTVFVASEKSYSQEISDVRSTAIKVVSYIAQIPHSAVHFKEVLLAMPVTHRQKIQDVIRASVSREQNTTVLKPTATSLKLQIPTEASRGPNFPPSPSVQSKKARTVEEEDEEEDEEDWDTFQSFPGSTQLDENERVGDAVDKFSEAEKSSVLENECDNLQEYPTSELLQQTQDSDRGQQDVGEAISDKPNSNNGERLFDPRVSATASLPCDDEEQQMVEEEAKPVEEREKNLSSRQEIGLAASTFDSNKDCEASTNLNSEGNNKNISDSLGGTTEAASSDTISTGERWRDSDANASSGQGKHADDEKKTSSEAEVIERVDADGGEEREHVEDENKNA